MSKQDLEKLIPAFISCRPDFKKLQLIQNTAASVWTRTRRTAPITPVLKSIHWILILKYYCWLINPLMESHPHPWKKYLWFTNPTALWTLQEASAGRSKSEPNGAKLLKHCVFSTSVFSLHSFSVSGCHFWLFNQSSPHLCRLFFEDLLCMLVVCNGHGWLSFTWCTTRLLPFLEEQNPKVTEG